MSLVNLKSAIKSSSSCLAARRGFLRVGVGAGESMGAGGGGTFEGRRDMNAA